MAGQPEDEAISIALHVGDTCVTTVAKVLEILFRAVESYKQARYAQTGEPQRGVIGSAVHAASSAARDAANKHVDGHGTVGFVKNSALGDDVTFVDASDVFDRDEAGGLTAEGRKQWASLRRALIDNGIGVSIARGVPGSGKIRIGVSAKNVNLLSDGLLKAGITLAEDGVIKPEEVPSVDAEMRGKGGAAIERKEDGEYPDAFSYQGLEFKASDEEPSTWVAVDKNDARKRISVQQLDDDCARWSITRNGRELASGMSSPIADYQEDGRVRAYKPGRPLSVIDGLGRRKPVTKVNPDGTAVLDPETGKPVVAREKQWCEPGDADAAGFEVRAGIDGASIALPGQPIEAAITDAAAKLELLSIDPKLRESVDSHVASISTANERAGKAEGGDSRHAAKAPGAKPRPSEQAELANVAAARQAHGARPEPASERRGPRR